MLRIARLTDYALVVLAHMVRQAHVCVHPASDIAEATGLPQPTVAKVLTTLCREGVLRSVRGAQGGYLLDRDPAEIRVADVIEAMEGPVALTACAVHGTGAPCSDLESCDLAGHWPTINRAVVGALRQVSLVDLARPSHELSLLAGRSMPPGASVPSPPLNAPES